MDDQFLTKPPASPQQSQLPQKPCFWCRIVCIVFVIVVFIGGGILGYRYLYTLGN